MRTACKELDRPDARILNGLEGPRSGRALFAGHERIVPNSRNHYSTLVPYVKNYFKCFGY
jgi:hypothetical protein